MLSYRDVQIARRIVGHGLGCEFLVDGEGIPKSVGVKGDERVYTGAILLSASQAHVRQVFEHPEGLATLNGVVSEILNSTQACRVALETTPDIPDGGLPLTEAV